MPETTRTRFYRTEAVVLKQVPLGDADRILTLLTPGIGKLRAVAKGVRKVKSKLAGHVEVLNHVKLSLSLGRSLDVIGQADTIHGFRKIRENLEALSYALYFADLIDGFTADESPSYSVYSLLLDSLHWLEDYEYQPLVSRYFEMRLLKNSGYMPELRRCIQCRSELQPSDHMFSLAMGGVICPDCRSSSFSQLMPVSLNAIKVLRHLQREEYPRAVNLKISSGLSAELERLMKADIVYHLEKEVKSASFVGLVASSRHN